MQKEASKHIRLSLDTRKEYQNQVKEPSDQVKVYSAPQKECACKYLHFASIKYTIDTKTILSNL